MHLDVRILAHQVKLNEEGKAISWNKITKTETKIKI